MSYSRMVKEGDTAVAVSLGRRAFSGTDCSFSYNITPRYPVQGMYVMYLEI